MVVCDEFVPNRLNVGVEDTVVVVAPPNIPPVAGVVEGFPNMLVWVVPAVPVDEPNKNPPPLEAVVVEDCVVLNPKVPVENKGFDVPADPKTLVVVLVWGVDVNEPNGLDDQGLDVVDKVAVVVAADPNPNAPVALDRKSVEAFMFGVFRWAT